MKTSADKKHDTLSANTHVGKPEQGRDLFFEDHPDERQLIAFGLGRCDDTLALAIERHVLTCDECCAKLNELPEDSLLQQLADQLVTSDRLPNQETEGGAAVFKSANATPAWQLVSQEFESLLKEHPKYRIVRQVGAGGMGVVYQATHRMMNRMVALKVIAPRLTTNPDVKKRFQREVQISAKLSHPNIVTSFDADEVGDYKFLVSEFIDGFGVDQLIDQGTISIQQACDIAIQTATGVGHAHQHGLIHRDIKPQNLLVSTNGVVKVVDFGLASYLNPELPDQQGLTAAGMVVGSVDYMSPEQARHGKTDCRSDIYSLGCTLYHMIAGSPPFAGESYVEKLAQHLQKVPKRLDEVRNDVPTSLADCIAKMLAKDPAQRFQSMDEVIATLGNPSYSSDQGNHQSARPNIRIQTVQQPQLKRRDPSKRRRLLAIIGGFAGAGLLAAAGGYRLISGLPANDLSNIRLLVVLPAGPLERDVRHLQEAIQEFGFEKQVVATSLWDDIPFWTGPTTPLHLVRPQEFHGLVFLGPATNVATELTTNPDAKRQLHRILASMNEEHRPVASYCSGVWPMARLGLIEGKHVADCVHTDTAFRAATGGTWMPGEKLVVDGQIITCSNEVVATPLIQAVLDKL